VFTSDASGNGTWQAVSATGALNAPTGAMTSPARALATTYQPNTSRPTLVITTVYMDALSSTVVGVDVLMDASSPPTTKIAQLVTYPVSGGEELCLMPVTFIVPVSCYYRFNTRAGASAPSALYTYEYAL
jgi:hypothetical protein